MQRLLRSPYETVGGLYHFGRMLDKIRLHSKGELPADYHPNLGHPMGLDGFCCGFLNVEYSKLVERTSLGGSDDEIIEWCFQNGMRPNDSQVAVWNGFARKFGWNDHATKFLHQVKKEDGSLTRTDIATAFDLIDLLES